MPQLTAREMRTRLTARFGCTEHQYGPEPMGPPEHLVLFEVPIDGPPKATEMPGVPGRAKRQRIDAVAVGMWAKTGNLVQGIEIKTSRADLLAELRNPQKAEAGMTACDRWWLALGDPSILKDSDELPPGWGVLAPHGRGLTVIVPAEPMPGVRDGRFVAGLLQAGMRSSTYRYSLGWWAGYQRGKIDGRKDPRTRAKLAEAMAEAFKTYELSAMAAQSLGWHSAVECNQEAYWYLPNAVRPFEQTSTRTRDRIGVLADLGLTVAQAHEHPTSEPEAKAVLAGYIRGGYGDSKLADLASRTLLAAS